MINVKPIAVAVCRASHPQLLVVPRGVEERMLLLFDALKCRVFSSYPA
jgi:hypothetical protein